MSATSHTKEISLSHQQHLMLDGVSWEFYERVLEEIGDRPIRVTFFHDSIEIMAPLLIHERACCAIQSLVNMLAFERDIEMRPFGSTTFRRKDKRVGHDPDACFYLKNDRRVRGMKQFDHAVHPPPDLETISSLRSYSDFRLTKGAKDGEKEKGGGAAADNLASERHVVGRG